MTTIRTTALAVSTTAAAILAIPANADFHGVTGLNYSVTAADFGGATVDVNVWDLYLNSDDAWEGTPGSGDTLLNIYNFNLPGMAPSSYFQSFTGTGWIPTNLGGPFDTEALQVADSFVTIGGFGFDARQTPGAGAGVGVDPNFGGNNAAAPGVDAGWYNSSPPNYIGGATDTQAGTGVLIARFASTLDNIWLEGLSFEATWNRGLGTPGQQAEFAWIPAPGSFALLGMAGILGSGRRRAS